MTKTCPFCAEEIQEAAIKCKHCGEMINQNLSAPINKKLNLKENKSLIKNVLDFLGILGTIILFVAIFVFGNTYRGNEILAWFIALLITIPFQMYLRSEFFEKIRNAFILVGCVSLFFFAYDKADKYYGKLRFDASMDQLRQEELLKLKEKELRLQEKELEERKKSREGSELGILTGIYCAVTRNC